MMRAVAWPAQIVRVSLLVIVLFLFPGVAWTGSLFLESSWNSDLRKVLIEQGDLTRDAIEQKIVSLPRQCVRGGVLDQADFTDEMCGGTRLVRAIRVGAVSIGALGVALVALVFLGRLFAAGDRHRLSVTFSPLLRLLLLFLGISVVGQAILVVYVAIAVEMAAFGFVHGGGLLAVSVGAIAGCGSLVKASIGAFRARPLRMSAIRLRAESSGELFALVRDTAEKLDAPMPDEIIVVLEPQFFVTRVPVKLATERDTLLTGTTLCLSLAMLHVISRVELTAIVGHELGHFRNLDLEYSLRFQPVYTRLSMSLRDLDLVTGFERISVLPAMAVLGICLSQFAAAERRIGREREMLADRAAVEAAGSRAFAGALLKSAIYSYAWAQVQISEVNRDRKTTSGVQAFCEAFEAQARALFGALAWDEVWPQLLAFKAPHPIDSHPPLQARLKSVGVEIGAGDVALVEPCGDAAISLIGDAVEADRCLSEQERESLRFRVFAATRATRRF